MNDRSSSTRKVIIIGGNAYRLMDGILQDAPVYIDGTIDEENWGEVTDADPGVDVEAITTWLRSNAVWPSQFHTLQELRFHSLQELVDTVIARLAKPSTNQTSPWTPGPIITREGYDRIAIIQDGFMPHAFVFNRGGGPLTDEDRANARVLSAALDLFEALQAATICVELQTPEGAKGTLPEWARNENGDPHYDVIAKRAHAAMARATGA